MFWPFSKSNSFFPANAIAVDLGTANTLIYVKGEGIVLNEPSVVALDRETKKIKGVGLEAKRMLGRTPDGIMAVRPMKDGVIADFDVTEKMLRYFLTLVIDKHVFKVKPRVIVCVPSGITEVEKRAVRDSALGAGAKEVFMVTEPMAAAIGVGLPVESPTGNMVIDIGGGTTEIAVIALSGIVSDTSIRTGGDELDISIVQFMRKNYNLLIGEPTAEQIKIQIGSAYPVGEEREMEVKGRDLVSGIPKTVRVHSSEIREAVQEPIQQIVDAVRRALEITPPELASDIVDRGIVMKGGAWYLVARVDGAPRTYRISRVLDLIVTEEHFDWPRDFDLAAYWSENTRRLELELYPNRTTIRLSPWGLKEIEHMAPPYVRANLELLGEPDALGWHTARLPVAHERMAVSEFLKLGTEVEVLDPPELREAMRRAAHALTERYAEPADLTK